MASLDSLYTRSRMPFDDLGLSPAILPEVPLPTKIRTAFQDPVRFEVGPERADDDAYVDRKYREVRRSIQSGIDALARRRRFPLFG